MADAEDNGTTGRLTRAVIEVARLAAGRVEWGRPPELYALVAKASLVAAGMDLPAQVSAMAPDALIPVAQQPLPNGDDLGEVLAGISWPADVPGCVLVAEVLVEGDGQAAERQARLTVGVLRDGVLRDGEPAERHACCVEQRNSGELIIGPDLADELVAALLGTL